MSDFFFYEYDKEFPDLTPEMVGEKNYPHKTK